jgi:hypothetical protein
VDPVPDPRFPLSRKSLISLVAKKTFECVLLDYWTYSRNCYSLRIRFRIRGFIFREKLVSPVAKTSKFKNPNFWMFFRKTVIPCGSRNGSARPTFEIFASSLVVKGCLFFLWPLLGFSGFSRVCSGRDKINLTSIQLSNRPENAEVNKSRLWFWANGRPSLGWCEKKKLKTHL